MLNDDCQHQPCCSFSGAARQKNVAGELIQRSAVRASNPEGQTKGNSANYNFKMSSLPMLASADLLEGR
ncbi:hypothetical protein PY650_31975 [Rhizobium calliandrae]|uniref:Uncharacterized protein n=1 Tax=Rhizobium calliandrae TaxID=1312182 RepID=A0ABT7KRY8_9HYPH|nr:hypothetical protein [Rhizobium calliandrae]MDL2410153.1 hypothetical protein [Rhizobium calliandrae]